MRNLGASLIGLFAAACGGGATSGMDPLTPDGDPPDCARGEAYPEPTEPMALGEVLFPYAWPDAIHRGTGARGALDLGAVPCATDPDIDWSPFDVLLFVSIPAW